MKSLDDDSLQKYCPKLEDFLKHDVYYDIDGLDLFSELKVLKEILQIKEYAQLTYDCFNLGPREPVVCGVRFL